MFRGVAIKVAIRKYCSSAWSKEFIEFRGMTQPASDDFILHPSFYNLNEQKVLLASSLRKLDSLGSREARRSRRQFALRRMAQDQIGQPINSLFLPDEFYGFEKGHFDGVIRNYRETHVSSWNEEDWPTVSSILDRLKVIMPEGKTQTHLLHLGTDGDILPHIDNLEASGSWILGVSLGAERILRMENENVTFDVLLPSGSVYLQRGTFRISYKHSILRNSTFRGRVLNGGQRVSIMIRDIREEHQCL
ncbi:hypothetical protein BD410DRAFT_413717 [Rickenella mellea]|uniref:Alpha-ketoglutarate-dependent dioxygenase AlkB-like domain-containing protein n=1 Tax=Rickenella mellea TaxID=50990 RepID=A0A4Y7QIR5_9AGAM|nr:hypothetical protein BD410DRAFT_413717 [Rickenella mellea]